MQQRESLARVDDEGRKRKVEIARDIIYRQNYAVDSRAVEALLKEQSLVPTFVSLKAIYITDSQADICCRMHFPKGLVRSVSIYF
jgi:hypothetical protein